MAEININTSPGEKVLECSICLDIFQIPIRQCIVGHSFCMKCINPNNITKCPECRSPISETRNFVLESMIEKFIVPCKNKNLGCTFMLSKVDIVQHEKECKYRLFKCEGALFCNWGCSWEGNDILDHYKTKHTTSVLEYNSNITLPYNSTSEFKDVQLTSAFYKLFWYKYKVDISKQKAFWVFQHIGLKKDALNYYFEFEIYMVPDNVRKFKVTEYCASDLDDVEDVFNSEKCVSISLKALKSYADENKNFFCRFRIMRVKKEETKPNPESSRRPHLPPRQNSTGPKPQAKHTNYRR